MRDLSDNPRFAIVGVGGVGGYLGGMLANSGLDVTFVARPKVADVLQTKGLTLKTVDGEIVLPSVSAVASPTSLSDVDVVLLTTKTYDLEEAVLSLPETVRRDSMLITFQNGIDNDLRLKARVPDTEVFPGVAYIVSACSSPGVIEQTAGPRTFLIGEREQEINQKLQSVALVMRDAGIDISASPNIEKELWTKYIWILAFAGVTATCRSPIGRIVNDPNGYRLFTRCVDEAITVARALNVNIGEAERSMVLRKADGYKTKGTGAKASLAIDLENGRRTEVEAIHGAIVQIASAIKIEVPTIETMYNAIRLSDPLSRQAVS
jgi:2-dehydropantoate 2-reductase